MILLVANTERVREVTLDVWCKKLLDVGTDAKVISPKDFEGKTTPRDFDISLDGCFDYEFYLRRLGSRNCSVSDASIFEDAVHFAWGVSSSIEPGVTGIVTVGSAYYKTRAAIQVAHNLGIPVCCAEWGIVSKNAESGNVTDTILTGNEAYYALHPTEEFSNFLDTWDGFSSDRIERYIAKWISAKSTKLQSDINYNKGLPVKWRTGEESIYFGQLALDAAMFFGVNHDRLAAGLRRLSFSDTYLKQHPRDKLSEGYIFDGIGAIKWGENVIAKDVSIHRIFEKSPHVIVTTSGVGVEAMLYNLPLRILGNPLYVAGQGSRERALRYLDYLITYLHVNPSSSKDLSDGICAVLRKHQPFNF